MKTKALLLLLFAGALAAQTAPSLITVTPAVPASVAIAPAPGLSCNLAQHVAAQTGSGVDVSCTVDGVTFALPTVVTTNGFSMSFTSAGNSLGFTLQSQTTATNTPAIAWTATAAAAGAPAQNAAGNF